MTRKPIPMEQIREAAMTRRSSLYQWMLQNHDTFAATVAEAVRPNWKALAETFAAEGLRDADNKEPSPEGTRQTWWKVRKVVKARRAKKPSDRVSDTKPETRVPAVKTEPDAPPPSAPEPSDDDFVKPFTIRTNKGKN